MSKHQSNPKRHLFLKESNVGINVFQFFPDMGQISNKFIFGTDWPSVDVNKNIEAIRNLKIPQDAISKILGENAKQLLGLV